MYWLTGIAGFLLMIAPYLFGYASDMAAFWTSITAGFVVLAASVWEGMESQRKNWEYWVVGIVGVVAIVAPFIFGFGSVNSAKWTTIILGAIIAILAGSKISSRSSQT